MYFALYTTIISLVGIIAMLSFRIWKIGAGKLSRIESHCDNHLYIFRHIHKVGHVVTRSGLYHGKRSIPYLRGFFRRIYSIAGRKSGLIGVRNLVRGNKYVKNTTIASSLFLKDINSHKKNMRERIENGKEKIVFD